MLFSPGYYKPSFNSGEIAEEAAGRTELKTYYSGARQMIRCEPVPQGGFNLMPGTRQISLLRGVLSEVCLLTLSYSPGPHSSGAIIAEGVLQEAVIAEAFDVSAISATIPCYVRLEVRETSQDEWIVLQNVRADTKTRNYRAALPPTKAKSLRYFRLVRGDDNADSIVSGSASLSILRENKKSSKAILTHFSISRDETYEAVFTEKHLDLYKDRAFVGCVATPYPESILDELRIEQQSRTMLIFHQDYTTNKVLQQSASDWLFGEQLWKNIPKADLGGEYTKTPDIWRLVVTQASPSQTQIDQSLLVLTIDGESSQAIALTNANGTDIQRQAIAANIKTKLEDMANIETGIIVTAEPYTESFTYVFKIEFQGDENLGSEFEVSGTVSSLATSAVTTTRITRADAGGEPLISATRGYAKTGYIDFQQRLFLAGFKAKPGAFLASVLGDSFNLNTDIVSADGGILINITSKLADNIERIVEARHLLFFTAEAEYFIADRSISKTTPPNIVQSSRNGCAKNIPIVLADDGVFYINRENSIIYACQYSDAAQAYESTPVSLLATHLTHSFVDAAFQRPKRGSDTGRYLLAREDGILISGSIVRGQEITGFVRWVTDGKVRRVISNGRDEIYLIVERIINEQKQLVLECFDETTFLDQIQEKTFSIPTQEIEGLEDLEGATIWAMADGFIEGPYVVEDAKVQLSTASTHVILGRWFPPLVETLPPNREIAANTVLRRLGKIVAVECSIMDTTSIAIGANEAAPKNVALYNFGMAVNQPIKPATKQVRVVGMPGFVKEPTVIITQKHPGWLKVRDLTIEQKL